MAEEETKATESSEAQPQEQQETISATSKKKKIGQMSLDDIEKQLVLVKNKMGSFGSKYARQLLKHKAVLSQ